MAVHIKKREDYISWDEYFMGVAMLSGMRSKDPNSQVGACIVSNDNKILSMGYNGFPKGCSDDEFPWAREGDPLDTKYLYVTHSELNAILNYRGGSLESRQSCMTVTNMNIRRLSLLPRECWMRPECAIINTIAPVKQSRFLCKMQEKGGILCDERG